MHDHVIAVCLLGIGIYCLQFDALRMMFWFESRDCLMKNSVLTIIIIIIILYTMAEVVYY